MTRHYSDTNYKSALDEILDILSDTTEGFGSDSSGDVDAPTGFFSLLTIDATSTPIFDTVDGTEDIATEYGVTENDVMGNFIVTVNDHGFIVVDSFDSAESARNEYQCRSDRYSFWADETRADSDTIYVCSVIGHGYHTL